MKRTVRTVVTLLIIAAIIGGGYGGWRAYQSWQAQKTWLDEKKLQTQAVLADENGAAPERTVLSASQQKEVVNKLKELPDPFSGEGKAAPPHEQAAGAVVFHFANRDTVCYISGTEGDYALTAYQANLYYSIPITKEQYDMVCQTVAEALSHKAKGSFGLRHWVDWKPTYATGCFKETGIRVLSQEEVYSITRLLRLRGVLSQDAVMNYMLRSSIPMDDLRLDVNWHMGNQAILDPGIEPSPDSVITFYYPNGFIKLVFYKDNPNSVFVISDSETGVYHLEQETSEIYLGTMNQILAESQRKLAENR